MTTTSNGFQGAGVKDEGDQLMPALPFQLGPYRLEKTLGRGGMGIVYAAYDQRLERRVAIKRMLKGSGDPKVRERLRREAKTTAQLTHPATIQVFDLVEDADGDWIVMELVEGTTLSALLKSGPLDVDSALRFGHQIAQGLAAAHRLGIVHRDLKTENVMVLPDGRIKILDFGIAKRLDLVTEGPNEQTLSQTGEVIGTSRAMSPEQARGSELGPRSDLFSFGVLLYEVTTGASPFRAKSPIETLTRVVTHRPEPIDQLRKDIPSSLSQLVERLMRKASELRPEGAEWVAGELSRIIESRRLTSSTTSEMEVEDAEATLAATHLHEDSLVEISSREDSSLQDPTHSYDHGFRVSNRPSAKWIWGLSATLLIALAVAAAVILPNASGSAGADQPEFKSNAENVATTTAQDVHEDPLGSYEAAMGILRRIDRPENIEHAIDIFSELLERAPHSAAAHAGLARALWEKSRNTTIGGDPVFLDQALAMAQEAVRLDGYLADARTSLGLTLFSKGQLDRATEELELALELGPRHPDALYGLGKVADAEHRADDAEAFFRRAVDLEPTPLYLDALGALLYDLGRYAEAEKAFRQSLDHAPDNVHALRNLGGVYYAQGRLDEAAAKFQSALKIHPNASLYSNLGTIFFSRGLYAKAAAAFEDALSLGGASNQYIFWLNLGDAYRQVPGKQADAQRSYLRALQMLDSRLKKSPDNVRARSRRALARARLDRCQDSQKDIDQILQQGTGGDLYSLFRVAVSEEICGQREEALNHLEQAFLAGFSISEARHEPDLQELRTDLGFHHILVAVETASEGPN